MPGKCVDCGACVVHCGYGALDVVRDRESREYMRLSYNPNLCNGCGDCIPACPHNAISIDDI